METKRTSRHPKRREKQKYRESVKLRVNPDSPIPKTDLERIGLAVGAGSEVVDPPLGEAGRGVDSVGGFAHPSVGEREGRRDLMDAVEDSSSAQRLPVLSQVCGFSRSRRARLSRLFPSSYTNASSTLLCPPPSPSPSRHSVATGLLQALSSRYDKERPTQQNRTRLPFRWFRARKDFIPALRH